MVTLRRYLSLCVLLFWQGGFTFYAAVVNPISRGVLHDHGQLPLAARITGPVTNALNWAGVCALALLLWDLAASADPSRRRHRLRGAAWAVLFVTLAGLFLNHAWLEALGSLDGQPSPDHTTFWVAHSLYLSACTLQWLAGLVYLGLTVSAWRAEDFGKETGEGKGKEGEK